MTHVYVQTHGCSANAAESEAMMGLLQKAGHTIVDDIEYADVSVINICTVKGNTVALREIRQVAEHFPDKKLVIAGCITIDIIPKIREITEEAGLLNTHNIHRIVEVVEEAMNGNALEALTQERIIKVDLPKVRINKIVGIIPISSGCDDRCAYCSVKLIKGNIFSYPEAYIVNEIKRNVEQGCREIWLTSQDNGAYGIDQGERKLHILLHAILNKVPGNYKIRVGMMNPRHVLPMLDELLKIYQDDRLYKFVHIPVEAGNNEILGKMNRKYSVHDFKYMAEQFRKYVPDITIASDLIVGFPSETESQFQDSLQLVNELRIDVLNIARFTPRPNTSAARMEEQVPIEIKKERSKQMTELFHSVSRKQNQRFIGSEASIVITEHGKNGQMIGRNASYKPVIVEGNYQLGDELKVKIIDAGTFDLKAEVIESIERMAHNVYY